MDAQEVRQWLFAEAGAANVISEPAALWAYGYDATMGYRGHPAAVVFPTGESQIARLLRRARQSGFKWMVRGGATSLAAGAVPPDGAIVIDTNRMQALREIDAARRLAVVEPGVVTRDFRGAVAREGLFYPPDPSSDAGATLGGNIATNAGGPYAFKYGVTRDYVQRLRVVNAEGELFDLRRPADGPLIDLMVGSEGTLGIVTEAALRLLPPPAHSEVRALVYDDGLMALRAVPEIIEAGLIPAKLEFLDDVTITALERARSWGLPRSAGGLLLLEFDGPRPAVSAELAKLDALLAADGSGGRLVGSETAGGWWAARKAITASLARIRPAKIGEDICVPRTKLAATAARVREAAARHNLTVAVFGHAADGTLHPNILYDPAIRAERLAALDLLAEIARAGVEAGGVLSGEHGLGRVKRPFVARAYDAQTLALMARIKSAADPRGALNPGAMWPNV